MTGTNLAPGWAERIAEEQAFPEIELGGRTYQRIRCGHEDERRPVPVPCGDCAVEHGQVHVFCCDQEQCPRCGAQLLSCDCE